MGLPVPWLLMFAPSWGWVVFANVLLGVNQGLCWSTTVIMKIDLVGPRRRGLAMGLNEFAGYMAVSVSAFLTGYLATLYGLRPVPFYPGVAFAVLGLTLSLFLVPETRAYAALESGGVGGERRASGPSFTHVLLLTSWKDKTLFAVSQAGLTNNLNDGMVWGLLPLLFAGSGLPLGQVGFLAASYPAVWGMSQLATGAERPLGAEVDDCGRHVGPVGGHRPVRGGDRLPGVAGRVRAAGAGDGHGLSDATRGGLRRRASRLASLRRGCLSPVARRRLRGRGLLSGLLADAFDLRVSVAAVAGLTFLSGLVVAVVMRETISKPYKDREAYHEKLVSRAPVPG